MEYLAVVTWPQNVVTKLSSLDLEQLTLEELWIFEFAAATILIVLLSFPQITVFSLLSSLTFWLLAQSKLGALTTECWGVLVLFFAAMNLFAASLVAASLVAATINSFKQSWRQELLKPSRQGWL